jgi:hypothetical protein
MKNKVFALFAAFVMLAASVSFSFADTGRKKAVKKRQANPAVALLPASDAVVTIDVKRFFGQALPTILASNQPMLSEITAHLDELQSKIGIDVRQFDQVAAGMTMKQVSAKETDLDPVVIARGSFNLSALVAAAKIASNGAYREEKVGDKTIYVFSIKQAAQKNAPKIANSKIAGVVDRAIDGLSHDVAVAALSTNTLAFGSLARVRQTVEGLTHVDLELTNLLSRKPASVMAFSAKTPTGMAKYLPLENDELGKNLDSIRFLYGSMDVTGNSAVVQVMARTLRNEQAQSLLETLQGLQVVGKALLGGSTGADKQVYARMIDNAQITRNGSEVVLDLSVPQSDIDVLVGRLK